MTPSNNTSIRAGLRINRKDAPVNATEQALKGMIALIDELVGLMDKEIALIETRKTKEHAELLKRKQRVAVDYRASVKSLAMQPELLKQLPEELRQKAKAASQRLSETSDRNSKCLRSAITALQRLIQTIIAIVKDEVLPKGAYVNPKDMKATLGAYSPLCKPVAVSRTA